MFAGGGFIKKGFEDVTKWFPIKDYRENEIYLKNGKKVLAFKVEPINFKLKSLNEQEVILSKYKNCLKAIRNWYAGFNSNWSSGFGEALF